MLQCHCLKGCIQKAALYFGAAAIRLGVYICSTWC